MSQIWAKWGNEYAEVVIPDNGGGFVTLLLSDKTEITVPTADVTVLKPRIRSWVWGLPEGATNIEIDIAKVDRLTPIFEEARQALLEIVKAADARELADDIARFEDDGNPHYGCES